MVCALALVGCNGRDGDGSQEPTTSPTTGSTSTTLDPERAAAIEAYTNFRRCYEAATNPMNPEHRCLGDTATGEELRTLTSRFLARRQAGEIFKGTVETAPVVASITADSATIRDCIFDRLGVYDAANPDVLKKPMDTHRVQETISLARVDGHWRVAGVDGKGEQCEPEA